MKFEVNYFRNLPFCKKIACIICIVLDFDFLIQSVKISRLRYLSFPWRVAFVTNFTCLAFWWSKNLWGVSGKKELVTLDFQFESISSHLRHHLAPYKTRPTAFSTHLRKTEIRHYQDTRILITPLSVFLETKIPHQSANRSPCLVVGCSRSSGRFRS